MSIEISTRLPITTINLIGEYYGFGWRIHRTSTVNLYKKCKLTSPNLPMRSVI